MENKLRRARKKWLLPLAMMPTWQAIKWIDEAKQIQLRATVASMESCTKTNLISAEVKPQSRAMRQVLVTL